MNMDSLSKLSMDGKIAVVTGSTPVSYTHLTLPTISPV